MQNPAKARIVGMGSYLPEKILTNEDLEKLVNTSDDWITTRTGIKERRIAGPNEFTSDMGLAAAKNALENARIPANQVDLILVATMTPDYISTCTGALIQAGLPGAEKAAAVDIQAACSGFLYALSMAKAYIDSGMYTCVLLVASEKMSTYVDYTDRGTCVLFGDGAAAAVVCDQGEGLLVDTITLGADGVPAQIVIVPGGGVCHPPSADSIAKGLHYFKMDGKEVFKHAVRRMTAVIHECLDKMHLTIQEISWLVPHQANMRIMDTIAKGFNLPAERMYRTVQKYGNTSASSIAIALHELIAEHPIDTQARILLVAFGAGLTWGAAILTKVSK